MSLKRLRIYWRVWYTLAAYAFEEASLNQATNFFFLAGKAIRFAMLLFFLFIIQKTFTRFGGYTTSQVIVFFLTYQFTDTLAQVFFRGVYTFSWQVRSGELDFYLSKPINPLFRILTGKPDAIDAFFIIPTTLISMWIFTRLGIAVSFSSLMTYVALIVNAFLIATAFHIFVICLGILTTEVDNAIMLYRDLSTMSRFPVDIYREPLRTVFFLLVPIGLMNTVPAQVLMNLHPTYAVTIAFSIGIGFLLLSLITWKISLKKYTSAGG